MFRLDVFGVRWRINDYESIVRFINLTRTRDLIILIVWIKRPYGTNEFSGSPYKAGCRTLWPWRNFIISNETKTRQTNRIQWRVNWERTHALRHNYSTGRFSMCGWVNRINFYFCFIPVKLECRSEFGVCSFTIYTKFEHIGVDNPRVFRRRFASVRYCKEV